MKHLQRCSILAMNVVMLLCAGCAGWKENIVSKPVTPLRKERAEEAVRSFEERRDAAQLQAALERWQQGDASGCEARLAAIVERRPDYAEARLRLGEVLLQRGDVEAAQQHMLAALEVQPNWAEAYHALGLLLAAEGREDEAATYLVRAAELEPQNEVYRLSHESVAGLPADEAAK
jgi:Tfp pilus assembly protein PilF